MKIIKEYKKAIGKHLPLIVILLLLSFFSWLLSILMPYYTGEYIDLLANKSFEKSFVLVKIFVLIFAGKLFISYFYSIILVKLKYKMTFTLKSTIYDRIKYYPLEFFKQSDYTYLAKRIDNDTGSVVSFIVENIFELILNFLKLIIIIYIIAKINLKVTLIMVSLTPLNIIVYMVFKRKLYNKGYVAKEAENDFFSSQSQQIKFTEIVKINNIFKLFSKKLDNDFRDFYNVVMDYSKVTILFNVLSNFTQYLPTLILMIITIKEIVEGNLTVGSFIIINNYYTLLTSIIMQQLNFGKTYQDIMVCHNRIKELMIHETEQNGKVMLEDIESINLSNIGFKYNDSKILISEFSYEFFRGNIYCITGGNGVGKSTLLDLISQMLKNYSGEIYYNNINTKDIDIYNVRGNLFGIMKQTPSIIKDTIINNLTLGNEKINEDSIKNVCNLFELNMEDYNLIVDYDNSKLSGGEFKKICIIRTILKQPQVLLLDEPEVALDQKSIQVLKSYLLSVKKEKIVIIVTHNDSVKKIADYIIDL